MITPTRAQRADNAILSIECSMGYKRQWSRFSYGALGSKVRKKALAFSNRFSFRVIE